MFGTLKFPPLQWIRLGDAVIQQNEIVSAQSDSGGVEIMFKNGNYVHVNDVTIDEYWKRVLEVNDNGTT